MEYNGSDSSVILLQLSHEFFLLLLLLLLLLLPRYYNIYMYAVRLCVNVCR